jgi:integrase/recombinase XerC
VPRGTDALIAAFVLHLRGSKGRSEQTVRTYVGRLYAFATWRVLSGRSGGLGQVTEDDVDAHLTSIGAHGPARASSAQALRAFYGWAYRRRLVAFNPAADADSRPPPPPPARIFDEDEIVRLLLAAAGHGQRRAWAILLCYALGTRRSELTGIRLEDVTRRTVEVRGKGRSQRTIVLGPMAREAIAGLTPGAKETLLGVKAQTFTMWVHQAAADAGLPWNRRRAHMLRASFASHSNWRGVPTTAIREVLGHSNIATTERYLASRPEDRRSF